MTLGSDADVYCLVETHRHHHPICVNCHATSEMDDNLFAELRKQIEKQYGFSPFLDHYAIFGLCTRCREK